MFTIQGEVDQVPYGTWPSTRNSIPAAGSRIAAAAVVVAVDGIDTAGVAVAEAEAVVVGAAVAAGMSVAVVVVEGGMHQSAEPQRRKSCSRTAEVAPPHWLLAGR